jgi:hypothetical protein
MTTDARSTELRLEVGRFRARESRRVFAPTVHVGDVAGERESFALHPADGPIDASLRIDLLGRLLESAPPDSTTAWLSRPGHPSVHDHDLEWLGAAHAAFGMHDRRLSDFYAITRSGWLDVRSGETRVWKRLRL